jgi:hypothetical protein
VGEGKARDPSWARGVLALEFSQKKEWCHSISFGKFGGVSDSGPRFQNNLKLSTIVVVSSHTWPTNELMIFEQVLLTHSNKQNVSLIQKEGVQSAIRHL